MRLSSISFTHGSTAMFGVAVVGYAALRLAGYDVPHDPGHLAMPGPSVIHRVPDTARPDSRSTQQNASAEDLVTRPADPGDDLHPQLAQDTLQGLDRVADTAVVVLTSSPAPQERLQDPPTNGETSAEGRYDAPSDGTLASRETPGATSAGREGDATTPSDAISADPEHHSPRAIPADSHGEAADAAADDDTAAHENASDD